MKEKRIQIHMSSVWLALTVVLFTMLQPFLCSLTMLVTGQTVSDFLQGVYSVMSIILAAVAFIPYFGYRKSPQNIGFRVDRFGYLLMAELWLITIFSLWRTVWYMAAGLTPVAILDNLTAIQTLSVIWTVLGIVAVAVILHWLIHISWHPNQKIGFGASLMHLIKHPLILLLTILCTILLPLSKIAAGTLGGWFNSGYNASYLSMMGTHLLEAVVYYFVLKLIFGVLRRAEAKDMQRAVQRGIPVTPEQYDVYGFPHSSSQNKRVRSLVSCGIAVVLLVGTTLYQNADNLFLSDATKIFYTVEVSMEEAELQMLKGNFDAVQQNVQTATEQLQALDSYVNESSAYDIRALFQKNKKDPMIGSIYLLKTGDCTAIEQKLRTGELGREWYPVLLDYYHTLDELTLEQTALHKEMLQVCIANELFTSDVVLASDVEEERLAIQHNLELYQTYLDMYNGLALVTNYGKDGGVTRELAYQALTLAEENPENMSLQYIACTIASAYQSDEADHYERTMETLARFDRLYEENEMEDTTRAQEKNMLGEMAMQCYEYETARAYFDFAYTLNPQTNYALQSAYCSERLGDYETCLAAAKNAVKEDAANTQALYLQCISALKLSDVDSALAAAGALSDLVESGQVADLLAAEQRLYICAQYMAMNDNDSWTDYQYCIYDTLSDVQKQKLQKHDLLWNYMTTIYQCFMVRDYAAAEETIDRVLAGQENLNYAWYLKGTVLGNEQRFEGALEAYLKAEKLNDTVPATLFSIANTYDALGEYEKAYQYCQRIAALMPDVDHGHDMYGIIYHNNRLMQALENELGIGG